MRKPRDGADSRLRVIEAAQDLFAANGFAGTSLAEISARCGISDGLILHHFQSKRVLYLKVLESLADQYSNHLNEARETSTSLEEMMRQMISASFNFWKEDSTYERVSLWAYLEGENGLVDREVALTAGMAQGIRQLQRQGIMDERYSPLVLMTMVIGSIHFWFRYRDLFKKSLGMEDTIDIMDQQFLDQLIKIVDEISNKKE